MPSDLIYREDAKDYVRHAFAKGLNVLEYLDEVPAANFRPVVRSKWIGKMTAGGTIAFCCNCGEEVKFADVSNFCPHCGADMREAGT